MLLAVRSKDRRSGTSTDFSVPIPVYKQIGKMRLVQMSFPNTIYNVSDVQGNNFYFNEGPEDIQVIVADGFYTFSTLMAVILAELNILSTGYTMTFNPTTYKYTIQNSSTEFTLRFPAQGSLATQMGFIPGQTYSVLHLHTSDNAVDLTTESRVLVQISNCSPNVTTALNGTIPFTFSVNNTVPFGTWNNYDVGSTYPFVQSVSFYPVVLGGLNIRMLNYEGNVIDLNGLDWEMVIEIE
jgi:hypothetical protein